MKPFVTRILICLVPCLVAGYLVSVAWNKYLQGQSGTTPSFNLGVDLVGGTILVYEIDPQKKPENYKPEDLAAALKRRIDPNDLLNVTIRPVSDTRVEIILPYGGAQKAAIEEQHWQELQAKIKDHWPALKEVNFNVSPGKQRELITKIQQDLGWIDLLASVRKKWPKLEKVEFADIEVGKLTELIERIQKQQVGASEADVKQFVEANYKLPDLQPIELFFAEEKGKTGGKRKDVSGEKVQEIKDLIAQVGSLEFRILANAEDDKEAIDSGIEYFKSAQSNPAVKATLERRAREGEPPPPPPFPEGQTSWSSGYTYSWVELGRSERKSLGLDNAAEKDPGRSQRWQQAAAAREKGEALLLGREEGSILLYSRKCQNSKLPDDERENKKYEYFLLVRDPERDKAITGNDLVNASETTDKNLRPAVAFRLNSRGGELFYEVTSKNSPTGPKGSEFYRHLAIILDGQIESAPRLITAIHSEGQITGNFTSKEVQNLIRILRAGALPATLKPLPVSENTIGPTLGSDTIKSGTFSVGLAFVAILLFMLVYYRFAGLVACVALLANLLLTVGFMVLVNATFTLPGLAGLVLMLGMAVDANVLIYERLREERDRGASLALAIRNGYDRAFPTIIDTHLSSIFTAIVLYAVGNDQLKGFGVSLTVGLIISLFTSLFMTRLMFDIWLAKGWLHKLSMFRLLSKTNIDFMAIRNVMFGATVIISIVGLAIFLIRGKEGLNIDFVGGTAYGGQLEPGEAKTITQLRELLSDDRQKELLKVEEVKQIDQDGRSFEITYAVGTPQKTQKIELANVAPGETNRDRERDVKERAQVLKDWSVEQLFLSSEPSEGGKSRFFTIRTSEKEPDLVQVTIDRLLSEQRDGQWVTLLKKIEVTNPSFDIKGREATLTFSDYASPGQVKALLDREFKAFGVKDQQPVEVHGEGENHEGRYKKMGVTLTEAAAQAVPAAKFQDILKEVKKAFEARPQPERLENFDSQLAQDTQTRAMYAVLASWAAILLYLWFRFGNWTFGLATVLCLVHDLCFTLGMIALSHYLHVWFPWLAHILLLQDFKIDLPAIAALLTLVGYSVNDTIVVFDRIREVRGKNPDLTFQMINDSVNQTLSRTLLTAFSVWLVVTVLYIWGGDGVHLFSFVMVAGVIVGTYSSIYIASPLLLIFGEGHKPSPYQERRPALTSERVEA